MQPTRILPDLQASVLCEDVRQESNGNFILVGVIGGVTVPQLPVGIFKLCVFNRWTAGIGQFTETVRLIAPDQTTVVRENKMKFALNDPAHHSTNVSLFAQFKLEAQGAYFVEVLVDDVLKVRYPIPVRVVPPPPQPGQRPAPTTETK